MFLRIIFCAFKPFNNYSKRINFGIQFCSKFPWNETERILVILDGNKKTAKNVLMWNKFLLSRMLIVFL